MYTVLNFLEKVSILHNNFYNYDKVIYINAKSNVIITCPIHGDFTQSPSNHSSGKGCVKCGVEKSRKCSVKTKSHFIKQINTIFKNKYDTYLVEYINDSHKVILICPTHGIFERRPSDLIQARGCQKCNFNNNKNGIKNNKDFITKSLLKFKERFSYENINYINTSTKVKIKCKIHGFFYQTPKNHLNSKEGGCRNCNSIKNSNLSEKLKRFILSSNNVHDNFYDYSRSIYLSSKKPIDIICPKHGLFTQTPNSHLRNKYGCPNCSKITYYDFMKKIKEVFKNKYEYNKIEYINNSTDVLIKCEIHGYFNRTPYSLMKGYGCTKCSLSKGESLISSYLEENKIKFKYQKTFKDCKYVSKLRFDFYLFDKKMCIEFDGRQHYEPVSHFGGEDNFQIIKIRDSIKDEYCTRNNIHLLRISYKDINNIESILNEKLNY